MIKRFCLYGFLKNQQYYDPFLLLAFLEKGMSFAVIGLLLGFRDLCINFMEIPSGAVADVLGRRRSMIVSFAGYIAAFAIFGLASSVWLMFVAMAFFSVGEAFRTGTHKAIIFEWLARNDRQSEKTKVYGFTRSWSKLGSALSVIIAAALVFTLKKYSWIFLMSIVPYMINIINLLTYPRYLDGETEHRNLREIVRLLLVSLRDSVRNRPLRRLIAESMGFEGGYAVTQYYLQPIIKAAAMALPAILGWSLLADLDERQRTAVLVGAVYFVLYLLSSYASRHSASVAARAGSEDRGAVWLWKMNLLTFVVIAAGLTVGALEWLPLTGAMGVAIAGFIGLSVIQNFWRPIQVSRFADRSDQKRMATVLSIESQGKAIFGAAISPLLGLAVQVLHDMYYAPDDPAVTSLQFLPVALAGVLIAVGILLTGRPAVTRQSEVAGKQIGKAR